MEPDGPDEHAVTNHGEVFIGLEEDFRGGRKQLQTEETFRKKQEHTCRQTGSCSGRQMHGRRTHVSHPAGRAAAEDLFSIL